MISYTVAGVGAVIVLVIGIAVGAAIGAASEFLRDLWFEARALFFGAMYVLGVLAALAVIVWAALKLSQT